MINIEELHADIEAGTPGGWETDCDIIVDRSGNWVADCAQKDLPRIARLPKLEREYLAMREGLEKIASASVVGFGPSAFGDAFRAIKLTANKALGENQ